MFLRKSAQEVGKLLLVSSRTVQRYSQRFMATGALDPQPLKNGPERKFSDFDELTLVNLVLTHPGIYLYELQHELFMTTGTEVDMLHYLSFFQTIGHNTPKDQAYCTPEK